MGDVKILDCTLRDGGYVNNWNFGKDSIIGFLKKISLTNIEFVEIGFLKGDVYDENKTLFPDKSSIYNVLKDKKDNIKYFGMYDVSAPNDIDKYGPRDEKTIDGVRVIFKKDKMKEGLEASKRFKDLGYLVSVNFVSTNFYSDDEFIDGIKKVNELKPYAMCIVDTFGSIKNDVFLHYVKLADKFLDSDIVLSYHAHNNLQQAYQNAISFVELKLDRDILIDASVFGMGRGAGNLNIELFTEYLNTHYDKNYHIVPMLEIMDVYLQDIYKRNFWGYSLPLYISGTLNVHPNYAIYLAEKNTLTEKSLYEIMSNIDDKDKQAYKKDVAEKYYIDYLNNYIDDSDTINKLSNELKNKKVMILAPGLSINKYKNEINNELSNGTIGISVNFYNNDFKTEYLFSSNMRRYNKLDGKYDVKTIITSNMREAINKDNVINFYSISIDDKDIIDNAGLMVIKLLIKLGIREVLIAGMDGYSVDNPYVYNDNSTQYDFSNIAEERNIKIKNELKNLKKYIDIEFLTPTIYDI